ncbi:MAG: hypothetical protein JW856_02260 [Dehalococcoidales bacterium]|nr:hypothetical protein [Dehalococcoidales bacterium]
MPDRGLISLDQAQIAAERFLEERLKGIKKISVDKVRLASIEGILIYDVAGTAMIGAWFIGKKTELPFKIQISATDGTAVGYETQTINS